ncbi:MAG TPA: GNAT family N-acetyltransferase [Patescibacteria group bacterium]
MTQVVFTHRALHKKEASLVSKKLRETPYITGYMPDELVCLDNSNIAEVDGRFAGVCITKDISSRWSEIAMMYVLPEFRNQGIGTTLFDQAFQSIRYKKRHLYCVSRNKSVIKLLHSQGFVFRSRIWQLPLPVILHIIRFSLNFYRVKEFVRKLFAFQKQDPFVYALLPYSKPVVRETADR